MSPRDRWAGLGAVDIETEDDGDKWGGLDAQEAPPAPSGDDEAWSALAGEEREPSVINQLPEVQIEGDPHAGEPQEGLWDRFLRISGEVGTREPPGALSIRDTPNDPIRNEAWDSAAKKSIVPAFAALAPVGAAGGVLGRLAGSAAVGGASGAAQSLIDTEEQDPERMAWEALANARDGATTGLAFGAGGEALGGAARLAGRGLSAAGNALGGLAKRAQNWAVGASGPEYRNIAASHGTEFADDIGQYAREALPHNRPWTARDYANAAEPLAQRTGQAVGDVVDQATQEVPMAAVADDLYGSMRGAASQHGSRINSVDQGMGRTQEGLIEAAQGRYQPGPEGFLNPRQLHSMKTDLETPAYPDPSYRHLPEGTSALAHRELANHPRRAMHDAVLGTGGPNAGGGATPETQEAWRTAFGEHGKASTLRDIASQRALAQDSQAQDVLSMRGIASALGGRYVPDATAMGLRGASSAAGATGRFMDDVGNSAAQMGNVTGRVTGASQQENPQDQRDRIAATGRGDMTEPAVKQLINSHPQAFGKFLPQFLHAQESEDPMALASLLGRLHSDQEWRTQYWPKILATTAPGATGGR